MVLTCQLRFLLVGASLSVTGCAKQPPPFPYPAAVQAGEQQHYKTALWSVSTSFLDSAVFRQPPSDSLWRTLAGLVSLKQRLVTVERGAGTICFRFEPVDRPGLSVVQVWGNCLRYGPPPMGIQPLVAVWVNQRDGLIDSVLNLNNVFSTGDQIQLEKGRWVPVERHQSRRRLFHTDSPFKRAFLRAHQARLAPDLQRLCREKGILK